MARSLSQLIPLILISIAISIAIWNILGGSISLGSISLDDNPGAGQYMDNDELTVSPGDNIKIYSNGKKQEGVVPCRPSVDSREFPITEIHTSISSPKPLDITTDNVEISDIGDHSDLDLGDLLTI